MSHSPAQMLQSEGEGVWGLARPGGTRHQDPRQGGRLQREPRVRPRACPTLPVSGAPQERGGPEEKSGLGLLRVGLCGEGGLSLSVRFRTLSSPSSLPSPALHPC